LPGVTVASDKVPLANSGCQFHQSDATIQNFLGCSEGGDACSEYDNPAACERDSTNENETTNVKEGIRIAKHATKALAVQVRTNTTFGAATRIGG